MKIAIIGGSIAGLSAAIALSCKGYEVSVYERSSKDLRDRGAGLVIQPDMARYLNKHGIVIKEVMGINTPYRQILDRNGRAVLKYRNDTSYTSWGYIWQQLKDYFPLSSYHLGYELENIENTETGATAFFKNGEKISADLIIGADGYRSLLRKSFLPHCHPSYAGYIAFRGLVHEKDLSPDFHHLLEEKFTYYSYEHSHILTYMVPGENGELSKGSRLLNWVWYLNKNEDELNYILIDKDSRSRDLSIPPGFLSENVIRDLHLQAKNELPEVLSFLVTKSHSPFVQVIEDLEVPIMYNKRVAIVGDAASIVRPHTASGTAKAYRDAIALANCLFHQNENIDKALIQWNEQQVERVHRLAEYGRTLALRSGLGFETSN